jgi:hypothetical protein
MPAGWPSSVWEKSENDLFSRYVKPLNDALDSSWKALQDEAAGLVSDVTTQAQTATRTLLPDPQRLFGQPESQPPAQQPQQDRWALPDPVQMFGGSREPEVTSGTVLPDQSPQGTPVRSPREMNAGAAPAAPGAAPVAPDEPVTRESVTRSAAAALTKAGLPSSMAPYVAAIAINEGILVPGTIARDHWSVGGVKAPGSAGVVTVPTREVINGQSVMQQASFGTFTSMQEGMDALATFVRDSPRFGPVVQQAAKSGDYAGMIEGFRQGGYATDPAWTQKVTSIAQGLPAPTAASQSQTASARPAGQAVRVVPNAAPNSYWTSEGTHGGAPAADIFADEGSPILAPVSGVSQPAVYPAGGNTTMLRGDDGRYYYLAHGQRPEHLLGEERFGRHRRGAVLEDARRQDPHPGRRPQSRGGAGRAGPADDAAGQHRPTVPRGRHPARQRRLPRAGQPRRVAAAADPGRADAGDQPTG